MEKMKLFQLTFLTALAPIFWGTTYIVTTEFLPPDRPLTAAVIRVLPAGIILLLYSMQMPAAKEIGRLVLLAFLNIGCFQSMLFASAYLLPGGIAAVAGSLQPLIIVLIMRIADRRRQNLTTLVFIVASIAGMCLMLVRKDAQLSVKGLAAAFTGAFVMALGTYLTSRWKFSLNKQAFAGWQLFLGGLMILPLVFIYEAEPLHLVMRNYFGYAYLALFGTLLAYYLWFQGVVELPAVAVSVLGLLSPVTAVAVGWIFIGQGLNLLQTIGFITVMVSVAVVQWSVNKRRN